MSYNGLLLLQDNCGGNGSSQDAFRVITENIPCGTTGTTCSKGIKIFLGVRGIELAKHPGVAQWCRGTRRDHVLGQALKIFCHTEL